MSSGLGRGQQWSLESETRQFGILATFNYTDSYKFQYAYDANGNITLATVGTNRARYTYDSANQLTREDNQAAGKTWVWTYDDAGNILTKKEYAYTEGALGSVLSTVSYTYDTTWGDLLKTWNGKTIQSDAIGNMTSDGTWSYTWEHGRELAAMSKSGITWSYTYDANGMRTKRTNGSTTYSYIYNGSQLSYMGVGSNELYFSYDGMGNPLKVLYNGTQYHYVTNLQGDILRILDEDRNTVVEYTYDAWGNLISTAGTKATTLGAHNPLRYRGYVYDTETGLYYLQSRYYNPAMGRFINGDAFASTGQGLLGNNIFVYCLNNPINSIDEDGRDAMAIPSAIAPLAFLPLIDGPLLVGDIILIGTVAVLGVAAAVEDSTPDAGFDAADVVHGYPSPNNDDDGDDDDDGYYDDDNNFGGRQKIGKPKGNSPGNNRVQNSQFRDATKGRMNKDQQRSLHDEITGQGFGFHDIVNAAKNLWFFIIGLFDEDDR